MTAMCLPCSRAPSATPASTGIKSPSVEIGETTLRSTISPKCEEASRPLVGDPDFAMYCIMMSAGEKPRTSSAPWLRIIGPSHSSLRRAYAEAQEQASCPNPKYTPPTRSEEHTSELQSL